MLWRRAFGRYLLLSLFRGKETNWPGGVTVNCHPVILPSGIGSMERLLNYSVLLGVLPSFFCSSMYQILVSSVYFV
jgi:hypothetical protein